MPVPFFYYYNQFFTLKLFKNVVVVVVVVIENMTEFVHLEIWLNIFMKIWLVPKGYHDASYFKIWFDQLVHELLVMNRRCWLVRIPSESIQVLYKRCTD